MDVMMGADMKKAPGGCGDIHQGQHGKSHCYENICIIPKSPKFYKGVVRTWEN